MSVTGFHFWIKACGVIMLQLAGSLGIRKAGAPLREFSRPYSSAGPSGTQSTSVAAKFVPVNRSGSASAIASA